jgi:uncharacterized protein (TIGR03066 family)
MTRRTRIALGLAAVAVVAAGAIWVGSYRSVGDKKHLAGTWMYVGGANKWNQTALTFAADGKMQMTTQWFGKTYDSAGTYVVKGNTIEMQIMDDNDWGEASWGNQGQKGDKHGTDPNSKSPTQSKQQREPMLVSVTIQSLSANELIVLDERGKMTVYAKM